MRARQIATGVVVLLVSLYLQVPTQARIIYVANDASGTGDGSSWENAALSVSGGIASSTPGDDVWVKAGRYNEHVSMKAGIRVYGGFAGSESSPDHRDLALYETILDATRLNADVVYAVRGSYLDGLTLAQGRSGIYMGDNRHTLLNCKIVDNETSGLSGNVTSLTMDHCLITDNTGPGINVTSSGLSTISNCIIRRSKSGANTSARGTAMDLSGFFAITDTLIEDNFGGYAAARAGRDVFFNRCVIRRNRGINGGGVSGSPMMYNCILYDNEANYGGAIHGSPQLVNCTIIDNRAYKAGGGIYFSSSPGPVVLNGSVINCIMWNPGEEFSGGVYAQEADVTYSCVQGGWPGQGNISAIPLFENREAKDFRLKAGSPCIDRGNPVNAPQDAFDGQVRPGSDGMTDMGAYESSPEMEPGPVTNTPRVYYVDAAAASGGGGSTPSSAFKTIADALTECTDRDEVRVSTGTYAEFLSMEPGVNITGGYPGSGFEGTILTPPASPSSAYENLIMGANQSTLSGFRIHNTTVNPDLNALSCHYASPSLVNCVIRGFLTSLICYHSSPEFVNCTIADNHTPITLSSAARPSFTNCILWNPGQEFVVRSQGGSATVRYSCIQGGWPGEGNISSYPDFADYGNGFFNLAAKSPCIDRASLLFAPQTDIEGTPRLAGDGKADIGAYETPPTFPQGPLDPPLTYHVRSDAEAGGNGLSWAAAFSSIHQSLWNATDKDMIWVAKGTYAGGIMLEPNVTVLGGFAGNETAYAQRDWNLNPTILKNDSGAFPVIVEGTDSSTLDGFVLRGTSSSRCTGFKSSYAASHLRNCVISSNNRCGIEILFGSLTMENCEVKENPATLGGLYVIGELSMSGCLVANNRAEYQAAGLSVSSGPLRIRNSTIENNESTLGAASGGLSVRNTNSAVLDNCIIRGNTAYHSGGGISTESSVLELRNTLISGNHAGLRGGGLSIQNGQVTMHGATMYSNNAGQSADIHREFAAVSIANSIIWSNTPSGMSPQAPAGFQISHSAVQGGWPGPGNIDSDPLFLSTAQHDFRLSPSSPCIDAGTNEFVASSDTDLDGNARIWDGDDVPGAVVDMGAYEYAAPPAWADANGDFAVSYLDLFTFASWWHDAVNETNSIADIRRDATIDESDLVQLLDELISE